MNHNLIILLIQLKFRGFIQVCKNYSLDHVLLVTQETAPYGSHSTCQPSASHNLSNTLDCNMCSWSGYWPSSGLEPGFAVVAHWVQFLRDAKTIHWTICTWSLRMPFLAGIKIYIKDTVSYIHGPVALFQIELTRGMLCIFYF